MEQNKIPDLLIVSILDESGRNLDFIPSLINSFSNSQNHIFFYDHFDETTHLTIRIGDKDFEGPYQTNGSESYISMSFYNRHTIIPPKQYYFLYFVRILILEYLYKEISGETFKLFQKSSFQKLNELIWMSILPQYAQTTFQNLSNHGDENVRRIVQESHSIVRDIGDAYSLLLNRARQVGGILAEKALPGISDPHNLLQYIFMYSDLGKVKEVTQAINNENEKGLFQLIDLLADRTHSNAKELLKGLSEARSLDSNIKDYAMKALLEWGADKGTQTSENARQTAKGGQVEVGTKVDSVPAALRDRNYELGTFREKLFSEVHGYLGENPRELFWPAWKAVLAAEPSVSEQMELALLSEGYTHLLAFVLTLEQTKNLDVIPFLDKISSEEVADDNIREIAIGVLQQIESDPKWPKHHVKVEVGIPVEHGLDQELDIVQTGRFGFSRDEEIPKDDLGYREYARALASVITDKDTETPLTIGICAPWGRGKTALMNFMCEEIAGFGSMSIKEKKPDHPDHKNASTIWFDAWRYSKAEQIWAGFMDVVLKEIEKPFNKLEKIKLAWKLNKGSSSPIFRQFIGFLILFLLVNALFSYGILFVISSIVIDFFTNIPLLAGIVIGYPITLAALFKLYGKALSSIWKISNNPVTEKVINLTSLPNYARHLESVHQITDDIKYLLKEYMKKTSVDRIVIFIDDIDRCRPESIIDILEALKHFLDIGGFVFVLGMDARVLRLAVGEQYKFMSKNRHQREEMGRFYLEKLIQIPFSLPRVSGEGLKNMNETLLKGYVEEKEPAVIQDVKQDQPPPKELQPEDIVHETEDVSANEGTKTTSEAENDEIITEDEKSDKKDDENEISIKSHFLIRSKISQTEYDNIVSILDIPGVEMSPRILKRFINIYLIARHLYIVSEEKHAESAHPPPDSLAKWLALSVMYPFEAKSLIDWLHYNKWIEPTGAKKGIFSKTTGKLLKKAGPVEFKGLDPDKINSFGQLYKAMKLSSSSIREVSTIANCFNLVLD